MKYKLENKHLEIELDGSFNFVAAREIEPLTDGADRVTIDLSQSKIIDSEGVILLYKILSKDKDLKLINPPNVIKEIIPALGLQEVIQLDKLVIWSPHLSYVTFIFEYAVVWSH